MYPPIILISLKMYHHSDRVSLVGFVSLFAIDLPPQHTFLEGPGLLLFDGYKKPFLTEGCNQILKYGSFGPLAARLYGEMKCLQCKF